MRLEYLVIFRYRCLIQEYISVLSPVFKEIAATIIHLHALPLLYSFIPSLIHDDPRPQETRSLAGKKGR